MKCHPLDFVCRGGGEREELGEGVVGDQTFFLVTILQLKVVLFQKKFELKAL